MIFDVLVVGGGHAGCEAALAASRLGCSVALVAQDLSRLAHMPCNPSIGGPAKGHLTREISALGGFQAQAADQSTIMVRWLNTSKGPAVRALRAQCDLTEFTTLYLTTLERDPNIWLFQDEVTALTFEKSRLSGAITRFGREIRAKTVVLTTGTHLEGRVHLGLQNFSSGPMGSAASRELAHQLRDLGCVALRLKTGTPPRLKGSSIDWSAIERQEGDDVPCAFDYFSTPRVVKERFCGLIRTNERTHDILRQWLHQSPIDQGNITGVGPRYCPSIESKVTAFPQKTSHPLFLEPTTRRGDEIYVQNFSTALPLAAQLEMVHSLPGLEKAHIVKPGYAIEYDAIDARCLWPWLEHRELEGLFFAGQINGTSGYEEAAAQGLWAGLNAALKTQDKAPQTLGRDEAYLGVLLDDLTSKGTAEPYRMLTSRCEYRLLLRHDNADRRLSAKAHDLGLLSDEKFDLLQRRWEAEEGHKRVLANLKLTPQQADQLLTAQGARTLGEGCRASDLLRRPEVKLKDLAPYLPEDFDLSLGEAAEIEFKYEGYIKRQDDAVERMRRLEDLKIPEDFDYDQLVGALTESLEKLKALRPRTFGAATRIGGVSAEDLQHLAMALRRKK